MPFVAANPPVSAPSNLVILLDAAAVVATAANAFPIGTMLYAVAESRLYICLPDYATPGDPIRPAVVNAGPLSFV